MKVQELIALLENESMGFLSEKEYNVQYVITTPPRYAQDNPEIWEQAFYEYLRRQGIKNPESLETVDNVEWNEVVRIYNTLLGKKNRPRAKDFIRKQKNLDLLLKYK